MALDFPNAPTNGQVYTAAGGEQWVYEAATNSWTSKGLVNTSGGLQYKGDINITAAPPAGVSSGWQYSVNPGGTANAGFGPGVTGTIAKGSMLMYTGTGWIETSHAVPDATPVVKGIDVRRWDRAGTVVSPANAGDTIQGGAGGVSVLGGGTVTVDNATSYALLGPAGLSAVLGASDLVAGHPAIQVTSRSAPAEKRAAIWGNGLFTLGNGTTNAVSLDPGTTGSPLVRDSQGRVGVGASTPEAILHTSQTVNGITPGLIVENKGTTGGSNAVTAILKTHDGTAVTVAGGLVATGSTWTYGTLPANAFQLSAARAGGLHLRVPNAPIVFANIGSDPDTLSESARIDSSGRLLVGTSSSPSAGNGQYARFVVQSNTVGAGGYISLQRNQSATLPLTNTSELGNINFGDDAGNSFASIQAFADADTANNDYPGRLVFSVCGDGKAAPEEAMRIKNTKVINFANAPTYADNTAAKAGGLVAGDVYKKADGTLMITF